MPDIYTVLTILTFAINDSQFKCAIYLKTISYFFDTPLFLRAQIVNQRVFIVS